MASDSEDAWKLNLIREPSQILAIAAGSRVVAVLGIKTDQQAEQPSYRVPQYLQQVGVKVVPVPVFYPEVTEILGEKVYRKVADVPDPIDTLVVFRKPSDIPAHIPDILAAKPRVVWLQSGISNQEAEDTFAKAGIQVVADRCIMVDHRAAAAAAGGAPSHL